MALADAEGLDAVTIRRLGQEFGVTPMALYWHVRNKDELLDAMGDQLYVHVQVPAATDAPWYDQLRVVVSELVASLRQHPGSLSLVYRRVLTSEPGMALTEYTLNLLCEAGFSVEQAAELASSALQTAIMLVGSEPGAELGVAADESAQLRAAKRAALERLPADRYPRLRQAAAYFADCDDPQRYYDSGITLYIEGARAMLALTAV